jgi:DNA-binding SARP family transcriptional activator
VLKYMAANREKRLVPREVLMELLWPDSDPERSSKNLNMALTSLRKTLEPAAPRGKSAYIISSGESLYLEVGGGGWVDAELYRNKISEAKNAKAAGNHDLCLEALHEAEGLYRGDFLEEDLYEEWCRGERESLKEEYLELLQDISNEYLGRCKDSEALRYVEKAIAADPGREGLYRNLMEICGKMGDRAGIERAFKRCSEYLRENFDVSPSRETEELYHSLRRE